MPIEDDTKSKALEALATILTQHELNGAQLVKFIQQHSIEIEEIRTRRLRNRGYIDYRMEVGRQVLRRHIEGETYREIAQNLDVRESRCSEIKRNHIQRIHRLLCKGKATTESLADEYGLNQNDIVEIYNREQERVDQLMSERWEMLTDDE